MLLLAEDELVRVNTALTTTLLPELLIVKFVAFDKDPITKLPFKVLGRPFPVFCVPLL